MDEKELETKKSQIKKNTEAVLEHRERNPNEELSQAWASEFLEAERLRAQQKIDDAVAGISKSFYETSFQSIEDDFEVLESFHFPFDCLSRKPTTLKPVQLTAMKCNSHKLTDLQKEMCKFFRNRIVVIFEHFSTPKALEDNHRSPLVMKCNPLPDMRCLETWVIPSLQPVSVPLYIIRHLGCMTPCKKMRMSEMVKKSKDDIMEDEMMAKEGFSFDSFLQITGTESLVRIFRLSAMKKKFSKLAYEG